MIEFAILVTVFVVIVAALFLPSDGMDSPFGGWSNEPSEYEQKMRARYRKNKEKDEDPYMEDDALAKLEELEHLSDFAKIDLCVLDTEAKIQAAVAKAKRDNRG